MRDEQGQGTVEYVGLLLLVALVFGALVAAGVRVPGVALAESVASRLLCAAALVDDCGDGPELIAEYGTEVGELVRRHMPTLMFEQGSKAVPVDFRRCRETACGDAARQGLVTRTDADLPITAFVHVIDCRDDVVEKTEAEGADCSDPRAGNLYIQYWTYYADSATFRGVPVLGDEGYHPDDWEGVMVRIRPDGSVDERASSHNGFNDRPGKVSGWASDAGAAPVKAAEEAIGLRSKNGWGPETRLLIISGGSHAGNSRGIPEPGRITFGRDVQLIPLEPIAATTNATFAISPPWLKHAWRDPEAERTD
jgi:hypothetical protein